MLAQCGADCVHHEWKQAELSTEQLLESLALPVERRDIRFVYDGEVANLYYPRDTLDSNGRFTDPPLKESWTINFQEAWSESLSNAQKNILSIVGKSELLDSSDFDRDVSAMGVLLKSPASFAEPIQ